MTLDPEIRASVAAEEAKTAPLTPAAWDEIEKRANAATEGPWLRGAHMVISTINEVIASCPQPQARGADCVANAAHIAGMDPRTTLALVTTIRAQAKFAETLFDAIAHGDDEYRSWLKQAIADHKAGRPVENPRGKNTAEALVAQAKEIERLREGLHGAEVAWSTALARRHGGTLEEQREPVLDAIRAALHQHGE